MAKKEGNPIGSIVGAVLGFLLARWLGWIFFIPLIIFIAFLFVQFATIKDAKRRDFVFYTTFTWSHVLAGMIFLLLAIGSGEAIWNAEMAGNMAELVVMAGLAGAVIWKPKVWLVVVALLLKFLLLMGMLDIGLPKATFSNPEGIGIIFNILMRSAALIALIYGGHRLYYASRSSEGSLSAVASSGRTSTDPHSEKPATDHRKIESPDS